MSDIATLPPSPTLAQQAALDEAKSYARQALSEATLRAYRIGWEDFCQWCRIGGWQHLPTQETTVAAYLGSLAKTHSRATLRQRLVAIGWYHQAAGYEWNPSHSAIRNTLKGIQRRHGTPAKQADAITTAEIKKLLSVCDDGLIGSRDKALILLGFAGALRRSELVAVHREHITFTHEGMKLLIPRAKTDQEGLGAEIGIPKGTKKETCPVLAMETWLRLSKTEDGPVFRRIDQWGGIDYTALHPDAVRQILKRLADKAGIKASPHGLRAGFVTEAYKAGARDEQIMEHTRHRDLKTMRGYVRRAKLMSESPVKLLGL